MSYSTGIQGYSAITGKAGKKGPKTYKAAKGPVGKGSYSGRGAKPAINKRMNMVDKKVKSVSNKIMRSKSVNPGPAAHNRMGVI